MSSPGKHTQVQDTHTHTHSGIYQNAAFSLVFGLLCTQILFLTEENENELQGSINPTLHNTVYTHRLVLRTARMSKSAGNSFFQAFDWPR